MSVRIGKALIVDADEKMRFAANALLLGSARQPFDYAGSVVEAIELLKANNYVCMFVASEIPALPGTAPRRQDTENLMEEMDRIKGDLKPPVVCMWHEMLDINLENFTSWVCDMSLRGVVKWVRKPFPSSGRTPDRMLKKVLNGQYVRLIKAAPLTPADLMAAPPKAENPPAGATAQRTRADVGDGEGSGCLTVHQAGGDLGAKMDDAALSAKPRKIVEGKEERDALLPALRQDAAHPATQAAQSAMVAGTKPAVQEESPSPTCWLSVPNEPVELDAFMAKFCEQRTKENRMCRKRALLAAARHGTVTLPPLAGGHKRGMPNRHLTRDLLAAWQGFVDKDVDVPPLRSDYITSDGPSGHQVVNHDA